MTRHWQRSANEVQNDLDVWVEEDWSSRAKPRIVYRGPGLIEVTGNFTFEELRTLASLVNTDAPDDGPDW